MDWFFRGRRNETKKIQTEKVTKNNDISIDEFDTGWQFFIKKIERFGEKKWGKFPCSKFTCSGCDDWLDADNQNRNVDKL